MSADVAVVQFTGVGDGEGVAVAVGNTVPPFALLVFPLGPQLVEQRNKTKTKREASKVLIGVDLITIGPSIQSIPVIIESKLNRVCLPKAIDEPS